MKLSPLKVTGQFLKETFPTKKSILYDEDGHIKTELSTWHLEQEIERPPGLSYKAKIVNLIIRNWGELSKMCYF